MLWVFFLAGTGKLVRVYRKSMEVTTQLTGKLEAAKDLQLGQ